MKVAKIVFNNLRNGSGIKKYARRSVNLLADIALVNIPAVAYFSPETNDKIRRKNIDKEMAKCRELHTSNHPVKDRTDINERALKKAGIPEMDRKKYIDKDGYMTKEGKRICTDKGVTNFKGAPSDDIMSNENAIPISDISQDSDIDDLMNADISLPDELQDIIDIPLSDADPGLVVDVMESLPDGFSADEDLLTNLRDLTGEILDYIG